jgi:DNA repair protein RecO (recombination protein O)
MSSRGFTLTAVILKRSNYREADRMVTAFTRERGKHRFIARGVRKLGSRRASFIEPLSIVHVTVVEGHGSVTTLTEASADRNGIVELTSLAAVSGYYFIAELVDQLLPEGEPHIKIFDFVCRSLAEIAVTPDNEIGPKLTVFTQILLSELGFVVPGKTFTGLSEAAAAVEQVTERRLRIRRFFMHIPA